MNVQSSVSRWEIVKKTFQTRFLAAMILMGVLFLAIQFLPALGLFFVLQIIIFLSLIEFYNLFRDTDFPPYKFLGIALGLLISCSFVFNALTLDVAFIGCLFIAVVHSLIFLKKKKSLAPFAYAMSLTIFGCLYLPLMLNYIYFLRLENGILYIYFLAIIIIFGDTGAYFVGKFWGKHQMAPKASPRKTWEGSLGGLVCAGLGGILVQQVLITDLKLWVAVLIALLVHTVAQMGDLLESLFKRAAGKKDSSSILGGHGGFLDRVDSFVLAAPFFYYVLQIFRMS